MSAPSAEDVLRRLRVPGWPNAYIIGFREKRVTVASQQLRALNLIAALAETSSGRPRILVVGGGAAGATAALAAAMEGYNVTLVEPDDLLFSRFRTVDTRQIHPHMYDWPLPTWSHSLAGLPILDWSAGSGVEVARMLQASWEDLQTVFPVKVVQGTVERIEPASPHVAVIRGSDGDVRSQAAEVVILATGFGDERHLSDFNSKGYWQDSDSSQRLPAGGSKRYLVSGCGDGGCIDLLKIAVGDFHQAAQVTELLPDEDHEVEAIKRALLGAEEKARGFPDAEAAAFLFDVYYRLATPQLDDRLGRRLHHRSRRGITVYLNGPSAVPVDRGSFILNRFLMVRVLKLLGLPADPGSDTGASNPYRSGRLRLVDAKAWIDDVAVTGVDEFVVRHGAEASWPDGVRDALESNAVANVDVLEANLWDGGCDAVEGSLRAVLLGRIARCVQRDALSLAQSLMEFVDDNVVRLAENLARLPEAVYGPTQRGFLGWFHEFAANPDKFEGDHLKALIGLLRASWRSGGSAVASARAILVALDHEIGRKHLLRMFLRRKQVRPGGSARVLPGEVMPRGPCLPWIQDPQRESTHWAIGIVGRTDHLVRFQPMEIADLELVVHWRPQLPHVVAPTQICALLPADGNATHLEDLGVRPVLPPLDKLTTLLDGAAASRPRVVLLPVGGLDPEVAAWLAALAERDGLAIVSGHEAGPGANGVVLLPGGGHLVLKKLLPCDCCPHPTAGFAGHPISLVYGLEQVVSPILCSDLLSLEVERVLARCGVSLVPVPACQHKSHDLVTRAAEIARRSGVVALVCHP